ncbi:MAG: ABC transporter permease [Burkholderiales bacterium]
MRFLPLLWSNLRRRKIRTVCTGLSILVAFVLIGALLSLRTGFSRGVDLTGADRLVVSQKTAVGQPMPLASRDRLAAISGVGSVTYFAAFRGTYQNPRNAFPQLAVDTDTWFEMYRDLWAVPADQLARWKRNRTGALVGQELAERFGWKIGDRIPLQSTTSSKPGGGAWEFTVDGIYQAGPSGMAGSDLMFFHYAYLNETRTLGRDLVDSYRVRVTDPARANEVAQRIDASFANSAFETITSTENAFVRAIAEQVGDVGAIVIAIMGPVLFTIILVCGNSMAQSIRERTNELAVLKTLGFTETRILALVIAESFVLPVLAGGIGLSAWVVIQRANPMAGALPMPPLSLQNVAFGVLIATVLGVIGGMVPAWRVHRLSIVDALRREG